MKVKDLIEELKQLPQDLDVILSNEFISKKTVDFQEPLYVNCKQGKACYWKDDVLKTRDCVLVTSNRTTN